jgi:hypothetical protein
LIVVSTVSQATGFRRELGLLDASAVVAGGIVGVGIFANPSNVARVVAVGFLAVVILTGPRLIYAMAADGLFFRRAAVLHPRYSTPAFALWCQAAVSLALSTTNTYDQLPSYVVFADWLFFGLTAGALVIVRRREGRATLHNRRAILLGSPEVSLPPPRRRRFGEPRRSSVPEQTSEGGKGSPYDGDRQIAPMPGHPWTTFAFIAVAAGIVVNSFFVYPAQSLIGSAILGAAAIAFFVSGRPAGLHSGARV